MRIVATGDLMMRAVGSSLVYRFLRSIPTMFGRIYCSGNQALVHRCGAYSPHRWSLLTSFGLMGLMQTQQVLLRSLNLLIDRFGPTLAVTRWRVARMPMEI